MSTINKKFCLVGLPKSGKSSFVAALWQVVEAKELPGSLQVSALPGNRVYLEKIREAWLNCDDMNRTSMEHISHISLDVKDNSNGNNAQFAFPDVKGEIFKQLFETREVSADYFKLLHEADGILLFIGDNITSPVLISTYEDAFEEEPPQKAVPWKHEYAPTQVVLVDLLQAIADITNTPLKVAVVVSAWDIHIAAGKTLGEKIEPELWLQKTLPLFFQFISTNKDKFTSRCFGISAQGAKYDDKGKAELFSFDSPSERIRVQVGNSVEISNDISIPLKWLLNSE